MDVARCCGGGIVVLVWGVNGKARNACMLWQLVAMSGNEAASTTPARVLKALC